MMLIFGHYFGIDEYGIFVIPVVLAIVLLRWAEKKAKAKREEAERETADVD